MYNYHVVAFLFNALPSYMYYLELILTFSISSLKRHESIVIICRFSVNINVIR